MHDAFIRALESRRESLNARFAYARRVNRRLDPDAFQNYLVTCVDPVVAALHEHGSSDAEIEELTVMLFGLSLDLVGRDLAGPGARHTAISFLWRELLPRVPAHLVAGGRDFVAALSNGAHNIATHATADAMGWLDRMEDLAARCRDVEELLRLGQVLAWRFGMAHLRDSAVGEWAKLPEGLRRSALDVDPGADLGAVEAGLADRWWRPSAEPIGARTPRMVASVGGFRGFGGPFTCPPGVLEVEGQLYALDNQYCYSIHEDCFGATLLRCGTSIPDGPSRGGAFAVAKDGGVRHGSQLLKFPLLHGVESWASSSDTLAIATTTSHNVTLVAMVAR